MIKTIASAGVLLAVASLSACSGTTDSGIQASETTPAASATAQSTPPSAPTPSASLSPSPSKSSSSTQPSSDHGVPVVVRPSEVPAADKITAKPENLKKPVTYSDGLTVKITAITQGKVTATGPGELTGQPVTTFKVEFTNGTKSAIDLNQVVVSAVYGSKNTSADPVYYGTINDFSGLLQPGADKAASYAFSIPTVHLSDATLVIDFDGKHIPAVFTGSAKS